MLIMEFKSQLDSRDLRASIALGLCVSWDLSHHRSHLGMRTATISQTYRESAIRKFPSHTEEKKDSREACRYALESQIYHFGTLTFSPVEWDNNSTIICKSN